MTTPTKTRERSQSSTSSYSASSRSTSSFDSRGQVDPRRTSYNGVQLKVEAVQESSPPEKKKRRREITRDRINTSIALLSANRENAAAEKQNQSSPNYHMSNITVRLFHHPSRTPITELQFMDPDTTLATLRALAEQRLASEEACMMRVFTRWYAEVMFGGRKRAIELTEQDEGASLASLGIEDYSEFLLEGPLTVDYEGIGQGIAIVGAQVRALKQQNTRIESILLRIAEGISDTSIVMSELVARERRSELLSSFPNSEFAARLALAADERRAFGLLSLQKVAMAEWLVVSNEEATARREILAATRSSYMWSLLPRFAIDATAPRADARLEGPYTAVMTTAGDVTIRASRPLSATNHRWAVRIHDVGSRMCMQLGLLPKLPAEHVAIMGELFISDLGGWGIYQNPDDDYSITDDWDCEPFPLSNGDLVLFDYNFRDKTLTNRCGDRQVVGYIPDAEGELYPAFSFGYPGTKISFEKYPQF